MNMDKKILLGTLAFAGALFFGTSEARAAEKSDRAGQLDTTLLDGRKGEKGFKSIFNGKDLSGWDGDPRLWSVKEGAITGETTAENPAKGNTFLIWTGTVSDFELRCSFKLVPGDAKGFANSGIQYRSKILDPANWVVGGYQADMDGGNNYTGICYEERGRGIVAQVGQKVELNENEAKPKVVGSTGDPKEIKAGIKKAGEWNEYIVTAKGNHLVQKLNGNVTVELTDNDTKKRMMEGILALQLHAGEPMLVQFKEITLKVME